MAKRIAKIILWTLLGVIVLTGLCVLLLFTEFAQTRIAKHFLDDFNETIAGRIEFASVHAGWSGELTLTEFSLRDSLNHEIMGLSKLRVRMNLWKLLNNEADIELIRLTNLRSDLTIDSTGNNLERALASSESDSPDTTAAESSSAWTIELHRLELDGGRTIIDVNGDRMLDIDTWELLASGFYGGDRIKYELTTYSESAFDIESDGVMELGEESINLRADATALFDSLFTAHLPEPLPALGEISFTTDSELLGDSLITDLSFRSSTAGELSATVRLADYNRDFYGSGELSFSQLNIAPFAGDTLQSDLNGALSFTKQQTPDFVNGWNLELIADDSRLLNHSVQTNLQIQSVDSTADLNGRIATGAGAVTLDLFADGFDPETMSVQGGLALRSLNFHAFVAEVPDTLSPISGKIDFDFPSIDPNTLEGNGYLRIEPFALGRQALDSLVIAGSISGDDFVVDTLCLRLDSIEVSGTALGALGDSLSFTLDGLIPELAYTTELLQSYELELDSLGGSVVWDFAGSASLAGDTLSKLKVQGILKGDNLRYGDYTVSAVELILHSFSMDDGDFEFDARADAASLGTQNLDSVIVSASGDYNHFSTQLQLWALGDTLQLATGFETQIEDGQFTFAVDSLNARAFGIDWQLRYPTDIYFVDDRVEVDGLTLASRFGVLRAVGFVQAEGAQDISLELSGFETASIAEFVAAEIPDARVNIRLQITGTDTALIGDLSMHIDSMIFDDKLVAEELFLTASTAGDSAVIDGYSLWHGDTLVTLEGTLPARLSFDEGFVLLEELPVSGRARVFEQRLSRINPWLGPGTKADGFLSVDMEISGTPRDPSWEGNFAVREGRYLDPQTGVNYRYMVINGKLFGDSLIIDQFRATARGTLTGSGYAIMGFPLPQRMNLKLKFDKFNVVESASQQARLSGNLAMTGPVDSLDLTGKLTLEEVLYRISQATSKNIEEIDLEKYLSKLRGDSIEQKGFVLSDLYGGMSHDLTLNIPGNCWVRGQGANIELTGILELDKKKNEEPVIDGTISVKRGTLRLLGRELTVETGNVEFTGPADDPYLDITAMEMKIYRREGAEIRARMFGQLSNTQIEFSGRTANGGALTEEEAIRALITGTVSGESNQDAQQTAAEIASGQLSEVVEQASGLDIFQFRPGEEGLNDLSKGSLEVGTYLTDRLFVRVLQPIETEQSGQEVNIEYQLKEWLKLIAEQRGRNKSAFDMFIQVEWR